MALMNGETVNGMPFYLNEPKMALNFLVEKFGFVVQVHPDKKKTDRVMVCDSYGNFYEIFSNIRKSADNKNDGNQIISTADCLQDFYNMDPKGLSILNKPHYVREGLAFEISDPWDNKYIFLEKRDYSDYENA